MDVEVAVITDAAMAADAKKTVADAEATAVVKEAATKPVLIYF